MTSVYSKAVTMMTTTIMETTAVRRRGDKPAALFY